MSSPNFMFSLIPMRSDTVDFFYSFTLKKTDFVSLLAGTQKKTKNSILTRWKENRFLIFSGCEMLCEIFLMMNGEVMGLKK